MITDVNLIQNLDQVQMSQIPLLLFAKFHTFSINLKKDIAFDISPFEKGETYLHIPCLVIAA